MMPKIAILSVYSIHRLDLLMEAHRVFCELHTESKNTYLLHGAESLLRS
jgi:hypothetical protein